MTETINTYSQLGAHLGCAGTSQAEMSRAIYKATNCGAWLSFEHFGVAVGSIVEGVDFDATPVELTFPFTMDEFNEAIQSIENECDYIWNQTHGCEDCDTPGEWGHDAINPNCPTCKGHGIII